MESNPARNAIAEAAAMVLSAVPERSLGRTLLNKALFYSDLVALLELGRTITPARYVALKNGPVVSDYKRTLLRRLEREGIAEVAEMASDDGSLPVTLRKEIQPDLLSPEEVRILTKIGREASKHRATDWSEWSHENPGWLLAWKAGLGAGQGTRLINMRIAIQQIVDDDAWLDEPIDSDLERSFSQAEKESSQPWD